MPATGLRCPTVGTRPEPGQGRSHQLAVPQRERLDSIGDPIGEHLRWDRDIFWERQLAQCVLGSDIDDVAPGGGAHAVKERGLNMRG